MKGKRMYMFKRLSLYFLVTSSFFSARGDLRYTDGKTILSLYQLMKDVHELFVKHEIPYWVDGGTLLGAVRHGGIIPWDNDLDICVAEQEATQVEALLNEFRKLGYRFSVIEFGYQIHGDHGAWLDIFLTSKDKKKKRIWYRRKATRCAFGRRDKHCIYIAAHELFPLKLYQFGAFQVYGPNEPVDFLKALYGEECLSIAKMQLSHSPNDFEKTGTALSSEHLGPGLPLGPLLDRVE